MVAGGSDRKIGGGGDIVPVAFFYRTTVFGVKADYTVSRILVGVAISACRYPGDLRSIEESDP